MSAAFLTPVFVATLDLPVDGLTLDVWTNSLSDDARTRSMIIVESLVQVKRAPVGGVARTLLGAPIPRSTSAGCPCCRAGCRRCGRSATGRVAPGS